MRIPQTAERIKEAPAQALRAVFAGVGQILLITERVRRRATGDGHNAGTAGVPETAAGAPETEVASEVAGASEVTAKASTAKASTGKASTAKASTGKASTAKASTAKASTGKASTAKASPKAAAETAPEMASGTETAAATESIRALPVPHYSELSIASLRARLRGLDIGQVRDLISYERSHEDRENVIAMFERRIAKLAEASGAGTAKG